MPHPLQGVSSLLGTDEHLALISNDLFQQDGEDGEQQAEDTPRGTPKRPAPAAADVNPGTHQPKLRHTTAEDSPGDNEPDMQEG